MSDTITVPAQEWGNLKERVQTLAREKSYLQLTNNLMCHLSEVPDLKHAASVIVRLVLDNLGGTNVALYYLMGSRIHYADVYGGRSEMKTVDDAMVRAVFERREFVEEVREFADTKMLTPAFTNASSWALPLQVGNRLVGVLKMEGMLLTAAEIRERLQPFFDYAALVLNNEVEGYLKTEEISRLAAIVQFSDDAIIGKTLDGVITSWNKGAEKVYGYTEQEVLGRHISLLVPSERRDELLPILAQISEGLPVDHYETTRRKKDGRIIPVSLAISPIKDAVGNIVGASTIARDITAQKRAEASLRAAYAYNRSLIEASLDPLVTIGPDGKITDVNVATEAATGLSRAELIGTDFCDYFTEPEKARAGYQQVYREGTVCDYPLDLRHRDGQVISVLYNASVYRDARGQIVGIFAAARDITERKRAEASLRAAYAYNRSLIEASLDPLVTIGPDGKITDVNVATEAATGLSRAELIGTDFCDYFTEPEKARAGYQQVYREGTVRDYPLDLRHRDGRVISVLYNASVYRDARGQIVGIFAAARDITERKRAEAELRRLNRALRTISECNQVLVRATDEKELLDAICQVIVKESAYRMAWVGFAEQDERKTVRPVARAGYEEGYIEKGNFTWADTEEGRGVGGTAIRTGKPAVCQNLLTDPNFARWRDEALKHGYAACLGVPLLKEGKALGALAIYSSEAEAFNTAEVKLLSELADDLAYGILALRIRAERRQVEEALRINEARYRMAQSTGRVGSWEYNVRTKQFWGSDEAKHIYGLASGQIGFSAEEIESCIPEKERVRQALVDLIETGKPYDLEFEIRPKTSSEPRIITSIAKLQRDEQGKPLLVVGVIQDITERKRAEEALRQSEHRKTILNQIAHIFLTTPDEKIYTQVLDVVLHAMKSRLGIFGFIGPDGDLVVPSLTGEVWSECRVSGKSVVFAKHTWGESLWGRAIRERTTFCSDGPFQTPEGHLHVDHFLAVPIVFGNSAIGLLSVANADHSYSQDDIELLESIAGSISPILNARMQRDLQEQKRQQAEAEIRKLNAELEQRVHERTAQLEAANKELEAFSYSVSHDLRAPLRAIHGFAGMLAEDYGKQLDEQGRHNLDTVRSEAERMGQLIDDLLKFSRMGRQAMQSAEVDMNTLAQRVFDECAAQVTGRKIQFKLHALPPARGDSALLREVWVNLISNAIKYTRTRPVAKIEITGKVMDAETVYCIKDNGVGFDMKYVNRLFGVFQRLHCDSDFEGTGVGLSLVQRIIQRHGGRVWAEGKVDEGAAFFFSLPKTVPSAS